MNDLRSELRKDLKGRIAWLGIGNRDYGDDAFGLTLAEALIHVGVQDVYPVGTQPERWIAQTDKTGFDQIVFLDAVESGEEPGSVVFLNGAGLTSRFPQISTHKISLGTLASLVESEGSAKTWLLGAQPATVRETVPMNRGNQLLGRDDSMSRPRTPERLTALRPGHRPSPTLPGFETSSSSPLSPPLEKTLQLLVPLVQQIAGDREASTLLINNGIEV